MTDEEIAKVSNEIIANMYSEFAYIAFVSIVGFILFRIGLWIHWHLF